MKITTTNTWASGAVAAAVPEPTREIHWSANTRRRQATGAFGVDSLTRVAKSVKGGLNHAISGSLAAVDSLSAPKKCRVPFTSRGEQEGMREEKVGRGKGGVGVSVALGTACIRFSHSARVREAGEKHRCLLDTVLQSAAVR